MCRIGDIVLIKEYKDINGDVVSQHPFIIIDDQNDQYKGFNIDFVGVAMSSFKNDNHREEVLKYISNFEVTVEDGANKPGYVKLNIIYYFDKSKIDYQVIGDVNVETFNKILEIIEILDCRKAIEDNFNNIM